MPKRKSDDSVKKLLKKIQKLERKVKRKCRSRSRSISQSKSLDRYCSENEEQEPVEFCADVSDLLDGAVDEIEPVPEPIEPPNTVDTGSNAIIASDSPTAGTSTSYEVLPNQEIPAESESVDSTMNKYLLELLGADPTTTDTFGSEIQKDLAVRLEHISTNGLSKELRKEINDKYLIPVNCRLINAPTLNVEIKAAVTEIIVKRDKNIELRQRQIAAAIACLSRAIDKLLSSSNADSNMVKMLMDAERILCDSQYNDSVVRRNFILSSLKKDMSEQLRSTKPDSLLFGQNLSETIKTAKAINKSGADLKNAVRKPPASVINKKQLSSTNTSSNLNWRGPYPIRKPPIPPKTTQRPSNKKPPSNSSRASQHQPSRGRR